MALILNIETSSDICSVCISKNGKSEKLMESKDERSHAKLLTTYIDKIIKEAGYTIQNFDAIAVSKGPGSYTGLRIGVSTAKGLCYAKDIPLIAINTLESMTVGVIESLRDNKISIENYEKAFFVPMIDAKRMEVYSAFFSSEGIITREVKAEILDENSYKDILLNQNMIFFGDGSNKIKSIIQHKNAFFIEDIRPSSKDMASLSYKAFENKAFEDVAYFEPFYLKDFVATVPKKNIFK